ncbi:MAG: hypothetical protein CMF48_05945 [Legionellales bacterium]|nr:hypothetical protein [Legionellales bacterium]
MTRDVTTYHYDVMGFVGDACHVKEEKADKKGTTIRNCYFNTNELAQVSSMAGETPISVPNRISAIACELLDEQGNPIQDNIQMPSFGPSQMPSIQGPQGPVPGNQDPGIDSSPVEIYKQPKSGYDWYR